jgi:hypothetical protein
MGASGRNDFTCPVCKKNFEDCPHSHADISRKREDDKLRKLIREVLKSEGLIP